MIPRQRIAFGDPRNWHVWKAIGNGLYTMIMRDAVNDALAVVIHVLTLWTLDEF
jgi:hypothetical protein